MKDRVPTKPGRVLVTPEGGGAPYYATLKREDIPTQEGTPLNKATLLSDATAALYGLGAEAVPDEVLGELGKYNQHWWKRRTIESHYEVFLVDNGNNSVYAQDPKTINQLYYYSPEVNISASGGITLKNPTSMSVNRSSTYSNINTLKGNFFYTTNIDSALVVGASKILNNTIYYVAPTASNATTSTYGIQLYCSTVTSIIITTGGSWTYLKSSDRDAYPDSGIVNGYEYQYLGIPFENAVTASKIEVGSYVGTGVYGSGNRNQLTFSFTPKIWGVVQRMTSTYLYPMPSILYWGAAAAGKVGFPSTIDDPYKQTVVYYSKSVSWYSDISSISQLNSIGETYYYYAIG